MENLEEKLNSIAETATPTPVQEIKETTNEQTVVAPTTPSGLVVNDVTTATPISEEVKNDQPTPTPTQQYRVPDGYELADENEEISDTFSSLMNSFDPSSLKNDQPTPTQQEVKNDETVAPTPIEKTSSTTVKNDANDVNDVNNTESAINKAFSGEKVEEEEPKNVVVQENTAPKLQDDPVRDILSTINVDLNSIEIDNELSPIQMSGLEDTLLNDHTTMLVTCCQSAYSAEMTALRSQEVQNIVNSDVDFYNYKKKLYQTIVKHIENTSVGKMNYAEWIHNTSFFDIDTLLYGIYCQTFNYENKYNIRCPRCGKDFDAIVNNATLVEIRGDEVETVEKINEIVNSIGNAAELLKHSNVHKTKRIILNESKIVVDIMIPSVYDYLEGVVAHSDNEALDEYQNAIGLLLFIKGIYLPNIYALKQTGSLKYVPVDINDKGKTITVISGLKLKDSQQLTDEINNFIEKYRVTYSIRNVTCPHCAHTIKNITMDMEDTLFNTTRRVMNGE